MSFASGMVLRMSAIALKIADGAPVGKVGNWFRHLGSILSHSFLAQ